MEDFEVEARCNAGGTSHTHKIIVGKGPGSYGASQPTNVRLQYTCPVTGEAVMVTFKPPDGAGRPFIVVKVT